VCVCVCVCVQTGKFYTITYGRGSVEGILATVCACDCAD
jgi:hypothetical protein